MKIIRHKKNFNELRGLTFVFNRDGSLYDRFLLLDKFWNMNQAECSMYSIIKNYKVKNIMNKEDGSIASFIKLPNGKIVAKSKASFISEQSIEIQRIYDNDPTIREFVNFCINNNIVPIMEYVSPQNRIVVPYANTDLILLRMRNNITGKYLDIENYVDKLDNITVADFYSEHTLDDLIELQNVVEGKEGWIVQFENGRMIKLKTKWYTERHNLFTSELRRENTLIKLIVNNTIDDVLSQIPEEVEKRKEVEHITDIINNYIKNISADVDKLLKEFKGDIKDFAIRHSKKSKKLFTIAIGVINGKDKFKLIEDKILNDTKHLMSAKKWIKDNEKLQLIKY